MSRTIETLLSPLNADDKQKGAIISLAILVMLIDQSIAKEEVSYLDMVLEKFKFGDNFEFAKFIAATKFAVQETLKDVEQQNKYIRDCVKNIYDKRYKSDALLMIKELSEANKKLSPNEAIIMEKIKKSFDSI